MEKEIKENFTRDDLARSIAELNVVLEEIKRKNLLSNPLNYDLPDLLFPREYAQGEIADDGTIKREKLYPGERYDKYKERRFNALNKFIAEDLYATKGNERIDIKLIPEQLKFIGDVFFRYTQKAIVWKCLHPDNYVLCNDDFVKIKDIEKGDTVINGDGEFVEVVKTGKRKHTGKIKWIKILGFPHPFGFTEDHRIKYKGEWIEAKDVEENFNLDFPKIKESFGIEKSLLEMYFRDNSLTEESNDSEIISNVFMSFLSLEKNPIIEKEDETWTLRASRNVKNDYVSAVEKVWVEEYDGFVYDIEVEGIEPSFLCPYITVHNCRGGGGSLAVAVLIWLMLVYYQQTVLDIAGSQDQALNVYKYVTSFWDCFPNLKEDLIDGKPLRTETRFTSGITLECLTSSDNAARGRHEPVLIVDEAAQKDHSKSEVFADAMNGTVTQEDHTIVLLSTFHIPVGFFQEHWDKWKEKGFTRYKWDVYDAQKKCNAGLEYATKEDPKALSYCRNSCPLTREINEYDEMGRVVAKSYEGCRGKARESIGFLTREQVIGFQALNEGSEKYRVEFECQRPEFSGPIFGIGNIENAVVDELPYEKTGKAIIGIDWGIAIEGAIVLVKDFGDFIGIVEGHCLSHKSLREWIDIIDRWQEEASEKQVTIFADKSHEFNNLEIEQKGYDIYQVHFNNRVRHMLENNVLRYFTHKKVKISRKGCGKIIDQLKKYRKNPLTGSIIKKDDHGPDAIEAAFAYPDFNFMERFKWYMKERIKNQFRDRGSGDDSGEEEDDENVQILQF